MLFLTVSHAPKTLILRARQDYAILAVAGTYAYAAWGMGAANGPAAAFAAAMRAVGLALLQRMLAALFLFVAMMRVINADVN
jgi:hypothetical protein